MGTPPPFKDQITLGLFNVFNEENSIVIAAILKKLVQMQLQGLLAIFNRTMAQNTNLNVAKYVNNMGCTAIQ